MQLESNQIFIEQFFKFELPEHGITQFTEEQIKNNDMKITLQIATKSYLRMQSDPKTNLISFTCKNYGRTCFEIFGQKKENSYIIQTDYTQVSHNKQCQSHRQSLEYLKIYNLMKLKKTLIQSYMITHKLLWSSPSQILTHISRNDEYFFEKNIDYNPELRRKLRKRFDNIINIDIKKITKGGRDQIDEEYQVGKQKNQVLNKNNFILKKTNFPLKEISQNQTTINKNLAYKNKSLEKIKKKVHNLALSFPTESKQQSTGQKQNQSIKHKTIKKTSKHSLKLKTRNTQRKIDEKQNFQGINKLLVKNKAIQQDDPIYDGQSSKSKSEQLKQIQELNQQFNGFQQFFSWSSEQHLQPIQNQTINDKLRENVFLSLRNSLLKKSLETQSLSNFPEHIVQFHSFQEDQQII